MLLDECKNRSKYSRKIVNVSRNLACYLLHVDKTCNTFPDFFLEMSCNLFCSNIFSSHLSRGCQSTSRSRTIRKTQIERCDVLQNMSLLLSSMKNSHNHTLGRRYENTNRAPNRRQLTVSNINHDRSRAWIFTDIDRDCTPSEKSFAPEPNIRLHLNRT